MKTSDIYLKFLDRDQNVILISVDSVISNGHPIDHETGDDRVLLNNNLYDKNGIAIVLPAKN